MSEKLTSQEVDIELVFFFNRSVSFSGIGTLQ